MQHEATTTMTLEEQIGQVMMVGFPEPTISHEISDLIQNHHVGGIILFSRNVQNPQQVLELTSGLQALARKAGQRYPLLIAIDQENGMVRRLGTGTTAFPGSMALAATGSERLAYDVAEATGRELRALGINFNLAPVVDVNNNPANPVVGVRSFGEDPEMVGRFASAVVRGYHASGIFSCLKHFPGHGDTSVDSHLALPTITSTVEELEALELVPFKAAIKAGADSVMIAHIYFPRLMTEILPGTVSASIIRSLLREKLGFNGLIISDCLEMNAVVEIVGAEHGAVMTLQSGTDLVLISHRYDRQRGGIAAIQAAVETGELTHDSLQQAVHRVMALKARLSWDDLSQATIPDLVGGEAHRRLAQQAYERSTTLVRNDDQLVPLRLQPDQRLLVLAPQSEALTMVEDTRYPDQLLAENIQRLTQAKIDARTIALQPTEAECADALHAAQDADMIVMATMNANLHPRQAELMRALIQTGKPVIGIAIRNPYDLLAFPELRTYLTTYEYTQPALVTAVRVLFGELQPRGRLPVSLPGLYTLGTA